MRKIIISVAPVASKDPGVTRNPLSPEEIAADVLACAKAGASQVHLHVRDREGKPTQNLTEFSRTIDMIRKGSDIIIQGSTGGVFDLSLADRCVSLNDPRVEVGTLNMGSANFGDGVYVNTLPDIRYWAGRMRENSVKPELEIFEAGMINNTLIIAAEKHIEPPFMYAFCLGFRGALPASADNLQFLKGLLPAGAIWGMVHEKMTDFSLLAAAVAMGASFIRVGFEDSIFYAPGRVAKTNAELVEKIAGVVREIGCEVADPAEARRIIGLPGMKG